MLNFVEKNLCPTYIHLLQKEYAMQRRDFLTGALTGLATGVALEEVARNVSQAPELQGGAQLAWYSKYAQPTFAQQGEDVIIKSIFKYHLKITKPSFIDIGAYHPAYSNNTFLMYLDGSRGVLVEPNPVYTELLKAGRPEDTVLNIGIGITDEKEADFYVYDHNSQLNTFSKERADEHIRKYGPGILKEVIKIPLVNINSVLEQYFEGAPDIFSIDVEGLDLAILETLDFSRFRPALFCVETGIFGSFDVNEGTYDLMQRHDYVLRANTYTNSIFIDNKLLV
jgi:FkbM family methyltransferase